MIGISAWLETVKWRIFEQQVAFAEASFVRMLSDVGADSVLIPVQQHLPVELVRRLDGLVLTGGPDIQSPRYAATTTEPPRPEVGRRDATELALARLALDERIPVLGVCRGCQVLNVVSGGTLVPEVADRYDSVIHTHYKDDGSVPFKFAEHHVEADPESPVAKALGSRFDVLSSHHQAVDAVAPDFRVAARSADELIEAIYAPDHPFAVGIQWHPEAGEDPTIFAALVEAARQRRAEGLPQGA